MLFLSNIRLKEKWRQAVSVYLQEQLLFLEKVSKLREFSFPQLIVVPLSCHEVDGVRKEKERLTAALSGCYVSLLVITCWFHRLKRCLAKDPFAQRLTVNLSVYNLMDVSRNLFQA